MSAHCDEANHAGPHVLYQVEAHGSDDGQCEWGFSSLSGIRKFHFQGAHSITVDELKFRMDALDGNEPSAVDVYDLATNERVIDGRRLLTAADKITVGVRSLASGRDLEEVARRIVLMALAQPYHCKTFVSKAASLASRCPEFPPEGVESSHTFVRALKKVCQETFESLVADNSQLDASVREHLMMDFVDFLGHLFMIPIPIITIPIIASVMNELIGGISKESSSRDPSSHVPEEFMVECACQLLQLVQDSERMQLPQGQRLTNLVVSRLSHLKNAAHPETSKPMYSAEAQQDIQDSIKQFCGDPTTRGAQ